MLFVVVEDSKEMRRSSRSMTVSAIMTAVSGLHRTSEDCCVGEGYRGGSNARGHGEVVITICKSELLRVNFT